MSGGLPTGQYLPTRNNSVLPSSLVEGRVKFEFPLSLKEVKAIRQDEIANAGGAASAALLFDSAISKQLKEVHEKCKNDLLDICNSLASEKKITVSSLINMQAITAMAEKLPETEADMMNIPHVTKANFEKIGKRLLSVTQHYAALKLSKKELVCFNGDLL